MVTLVAHHILAPKIGVLPSNDSLLVRTLAAGRAFWFYLAKDLLPVGLTLHYPRLTINPMSPLAYLPGLALVGMFAVFWRFRQKWGRSCLFGLGYFVLALGPTIGVINMAFLLLAQVADHFQYLALPGIIALVTGGALYHLQRRMGQSPQALQCMLFILFVVPLAALCWHHQRVMANPEALWRDNLRKNPNSWISYNNLGGVHFGREEYPEAERLYREALARRDGLSMLRVNLGRSLFGQGRTDEAIEQYFAAIRLDAGDFKAYNNLGVALITLGKTNDAIASFQKAVELAPRDATFFSNLVRLLSEAGHSERTIPLYRDWLARFPDDYTAHFRLGAVLFDQHALEEARLHYQEAVRLKPDFAEARFGLAEILTRLNQNAEAVAQWNEILRINPNAVQVIANLAWLRATARDDSLRDGAEAVRLAKRACAMEEKNPAYRYLLAAAHAEAGQFPEAIRIAEEAALLAETMGQPDLAERCRSDLTLYKSGRPRREP